MGWFDPKCPVDKEAKEWLDEAFVWLVGELGADVVRGVEVILPSEDYFPVPIDGSDASIRATFEKVCHYMDVDSRVIRLELYEVETGGNVHPLATAEKGSHALGTYQLGRNGRYNIRLETSQAANAQALIATIAHELGHVILLGEGRLDPEYADHEPMTDLVSIFYGFGIFSANSIFSFAQFTNVFGQGWSAERHGYLTEEMCGYALALFAIARGEEMPAWTSYLNRNVRTYMKNSLKFLKVSGNLPSEFTQVCRLEPSKK